MFKTWSFRVLILVLSLGLVCSQRVKNPNDYYLKGGNVCPNTRYESATYPPMSEVTHFMETRETSCGIFGWARCSVTRKATKTTYVIRTGSVAVTLMSCCPGWSSTKSIGGKIFCNQPRCTLGCGPNGGICIAPDKCECKSGWTGTFCERDINECENNNGNCQHTCTNKPGSYECGCNKGYVKDKIPGINMEICIDLDECKYQKDPPACRCANIKEAECNATCINEIGSYRCTCNKGYRLIASTICEDIDECLSPITNTCNLKCLNLPGSYSCHCPRGFLLGKDGSTCEDEDECKPKKKLCQHRCINTYGSYRCRCNRGFIRHPNGRQCIDVDECKISSPCEMTCINLHGSYRCSCPDGYTLNNDNFTCSDIDECKKNFLSDCEQLCTNTKGSFKCSCKRGYRLRQNEKACEDVDECMTGAHKCDQKCQNIIGSYICSCGPGYKLKDKKICQALPCESIESPIHGSMKCNGFSTGSKCTFQCDPEYDLLGSEESTCLPSGKWNGTRVKCKVKLCPKLAAPENAEVLLPCHNTIRSRCSLECLDGFHSDEGGVATCELDSSSGFGEWNLKNFHCKELKLCLPNPCLNGGKCSIHNNKNFYCDCEDTGFEGPRCETGIITMPTYQRLKTNQESKVYHLNAQPNNELRVTIRSTQAILVKPQSELRISKLSRQVAFTLVPKKTGLHIISYTLDGNDAKVFKVPEENTIFVGPDIIKDTTVYNILQISKGNLPEGCHELPRPLFQCSAHLTSTFPWGTPSDTLTEGIVHLQSKSFKIPISLFGGNLNELSLTREQLLSKIEDMSSQNVAAGTDLSFIKDGKCHSIPMKKDYLFEFIQNDALPRSIFRSLSSVLPPWIQLHLDQSNDVFDVTNLMVSVRKPISDGSGMCEQLPISPSSVFFKPSIAFNTKIGDETKAFKSKEHVCLALDVCQNKSFMDLSSQARKRFQQMKIFKDMKNTGWDFKVSSFGMQSHRSDDAVGKNNFDIWMKGEMKVRMTGPRVAVHLNNTGEIFTKSDCPQELLSSQFTCSISGSAKGRITMQTSIKSDDSELIPLKLKSESMVGQFLFGGDKCDQGINFTLTSSENPVKGTMLSQFILPYLKYPMNVTINHDISGGGQSGVQIPNNLGTTVMLLGFIMQQFQFTMQSIPNMVPDLGSDANKLLKIVNDVNAQATTMRQLVMSSIGKTLVNQEAQSIINKVKSLNEKVENILTMTTALSQKLSSHTSNPMVSAIVAQLQSYKSNLELSAKSLKLDVQRSPVTQSIKGLSIGMMSQVCIGRLCVPYVKAKILANNDDAATTACPRKNINAGATAKQQTIPYVLISPSKNIKLGRLLQVKEGEEMRMDVSKKLMRFKTTMSLFGMTKTVNLNLTDEQLHVKVKGNIFNKFESEINVTADAKVEEWESLVFKASGKIGSRLPRMLENSVNQYAITLVQKAENRIRKAKGILENNINKTINAGTILISKREVWNLLKRKKTNLENKLRRKRNDFHEFFLNFEYAIKEHDKDVKDMLSRSCNLTECKRLCSKTCIPDMCWDKAIIQYQKHDCVEVNVPYTKFVPGEMTREVTYPTTPMIRRDVGKCKSFFTGLAEGLIKGAGKLALGSLLGRRKKRSITGVKDFQNIPNFNDFLKKSNPNLPRDFNINAELRKLSGKLPKDFDFNKLLASYFIKQHKFDPSEILKKHFPALPADFDFDEEVTKAMPELRNNFDFNQVMKDAIFKAKRLKRKVDLKSELIKRIPELRNTDLDRVLKKFSPPLRSLKDITGQIQSSLEDVLSYNVNNNLLERFDVNDIIKTKLRGLHRDVDLNKLLRQGIPQLSENFNLNRLLTDAVKLNPGNLADINLNKLVGGAMGSISGLQNFDLQKTIQGVVPGFAKGLNFGKLIQDKLQDVVSVGVNPLKFANLNFNDMIKTRLPIVRDLGINKIFKKAFSLEEIPNFGKILGNAGSLMNMVEDFNINNIVKGAFRHLPGKLNLNIGDALRRNIPALRGIGNIEEILKGNLKEFFNLNPENILKQIPIPGLSNLPGPVTDLMGKMGIGNLGDAMKSMKDIFNKDFLGNIGNAFKNFGDNLATNFVGSFGNIIGGSIISAFTNSGCKHKYVTKAGPTENRTYQETRAIMVAKQFPEVQWKCTNPRMVNMTSEGFEPRSCCRKDIKCVEFLDPQCLKRNQECFKEKRNNFKIEQSSLDAVILNDYPDLIESEKELAHIELQLEEARLQEQNAAQGYRIVSARLRQLQALENASRISISKMKSIPDVDLGLKLKTILDKSYKERPLRMSPLFFHTVTSSLSNSRLPLKGTVTSKDGPDLTFNFIMDFEDVHFSIDHTTKSVIQKLAQSIGISRKRRSVEIDFSNSSRRSDPIEENEKCLLARNTSMLFSEILNSLHKLLKSKFAQDSEISNEIAALDNLEVALADDAARSSENDLSKNYVKAISLYKEQRNEQSRMVSWNETIVGWRNFVENITESRNLDYCSNALDCVEELSERLVELYRSVKNNTKARELQILLPRLADGMKELMEEELEMEEVKSKLQNLTIVLNKTYDVSVLCGEKPVMLTPNNNKQVNRLVGENIKLSCLAKSNANVIYTWRRDNTVLKVSDKSGDLELLSLNETSQGLYRCEAANHKGSTFSGITALIIQRKPTIFEHPTDVQVPLDKQSGVTFSCAVKGKPLATIKWLFEPLSSNLSVELTNENSNLLYIVPDEVEKSGHYYCEASNERGKAVSRKARLDVLSITATNPKIAVIFNVTNECVASSCQGQNTQSIPSRLDKTLKTSITKLVTTSMNVSRKSISNIRYIPLSKSKAKIYFFLSESVKVNAIDFLQDEVMEKFAEARVNVVGKLKRLMHAMNRTTFITQRSKESLIGIAKTLGFLYMAPDCPSGQYLHDNGFMCVQCPPGSYKDGLEETCNKCPIGTYQPKPGQASCIKCGQDKTTLERSTIEESQCIEKELCGPGTFNQVLDDICSKCPMGTYQPRRGQTSCIKCGPHKTTLLEGSSNRSQCIQKDVCPPGSFKTVLDGGCMKCPIGSYQPQSGQNSCVFCGPKKTTLRQGSINETQCIQKEECPPGTFEDKDSNCTRCPPKTYQPQAGQKQCIPCIHSLGPLKDVEGRTTCEKPGPGQPRSLLAFSVGSDSLKIVWWKPETGEVSHYELEYGFIKQTPLGTIRVLPGKDWASGESYRLRGLLKFTVYRIKVYTVVNGERSKPAVITIRSMDDVPERSPTITSVTAVNATAISVTWQKLPISQRNGIILGYEVYVKKRKDSLFKKHNIDGRDKLSTVLSNLKEDKLYCIKMTAFTRKGAYPHWQRNGCKYARTLRKVSRIFSNVTAQVIGQNTATITWKHKDGNLKNQFVVYYGKQERHMDQTATCKAQLCTILNLEGGTTYYAEVHAVGQNDVSKVVSFTTALM